MKISLNWVKEYTEVVLPLEQLVEKIGAQLGAVEEVVDLGKKYEGIVIAKVIACEKHINADKLSVCLIDDGGAIQNVRRVDNHYIEVVCGAPNVREGLTVAWIPPGATVPASHDKEPFVLEAREIRGVVSNGMLASQAELALSDDHEGILELGDDIKPGTSFAEALKLNDVIIDVENKMFTHRPDCFGILGIAREIAGIQQQPFTSPDWYRQKPTFQAASGLALTVRNDLPKEVPRFMAVAMKDIEVKSSSQWLQATLLKVGLKPINNVVDITNYLMYLTGQPLHAYDYDKVAALSGEGAALTVRYPKTGESVGLLNGKTIEPRPEAVMIATDKTVIGVGGVMGGSNTEVDNNTRTIIIECANFDMYSVRRTAMAHGLFTDAVTRFNKGQSPLQNDRIIAQAMEMVEELVGGTQASAVIDDNHTAQDVTSVQVTAEFINLRLGLRLSSGEIKKLLENVEFVVSDNGGELTVQSPFWRTDIEIPEDIVEEVGRLYGYDHLPLVLPESSIKPAGRDPLLEFKSKVRTILADAGANEILTYNFVHANLLERVGQDKKLAFQLSNALSPDLQYFRLSLTPNVLEKIRPNIKADYGEFALFEIGKAHVKGLKDSDEPDVPQELERVSLVYAADDKTWTQSHAGAAYYQARQYASEMLSKLGIDATFTSGKQHQPESDEAKQCWGPFEPSRSAYVQTRSGEPLGMVGEFNAASRRNLKLPTRTAGFEFNLTQLMQHAQGLRYQAVPRFPRVDQDLSLKVPIELSHGELVDFVTSKVRELKPDNTTLAVSTLDIYQAESDAAHKHVTLRFSTASYERTLTAEEVNALLDNAAAAAKEKFGADRI